MNALAWANRHNACQEAILWLERQGDITMDEAWARCTDPHWMLWALGRVNHSAEPDRAYRLLACDFATRALERERKAGREPDPRSWRAIKVARDYAHGAATRLELDAARAAAGDAAWDAERAAAMDAAHAARYAASAAEQAWQCDRIRDAFAPGEKT